MRLDLTKLRCDRNTFAQELQKRGVGISVHFIPVFHFSYWNKLYEGFDAAHFPNAEQHYNETISIPLFPDMTEEDISFVIGTIKQIGESYHA